MPQPNSFTTNRADGLTVGTVNLTTGETDVELTCGDARSKLDAISADEFPHIHEAGESSYSLGITARSVGLAVNGLAGAIDQVIIAATQDKSCPRRPSQCLVSCRGFFGVLSALCQVFTHCPHPAQLPGSGRHLDLVGLSEQMLTVIIAGS